MHAHVLRRPVKVQADYSPSPCDCPLHSYPLARHYVPIQVPHEKMMVRQRQYG